MAIPIMIKIAVPITSLFVCYGKDTNGAMRNSYKKARLGRPNGDFDPQLLGLGNLTAPVKV